MRLVIDRDHFGGATMGRLMMGDVGAERFFLYTLEPSTALLEHGPIAEGGPYDVVFEYSPKFQREMPHIHVPGRLFVMFHPLNWAWQTEGCVGVGQERDLDKEELEHSMAAFEQLIGEMRAAIARGEKISVEVIAT